ncbi:MAG TPA: T9SS type A sorting domain-containing protein [Candidatus Eisenbacteria bacterium]|nr:T9SS type A sorting domain-containing protein [Candidatus Eisenbacteria bacterium]
MERVRVPHTPSRMGHSWSLVCAVFLITLAVAPLGAEESPAVMGPRSTFETHRSLREKLVERLSRDAASPVAEVDAPVRADYTNGWARVLNDRGQVAGDVAGPGQQRGFFWSEGLAVDMGLQDPRVFDLNNRGQVVGYLENTFLPFLWDAGVVRTLEVTPEMPFGAGYAINDRGQVAGAIANASQERAAMWDGAVLTLLPTLNGELSEATGINQHGVMIGWATTPGGHTHAVLWENGALVDLSPEAIYAVAVSINDRGQVLIRDFGGRGFLWERGTRTDLGTLGGSSCIPYAMNARGQVVGSSSTAEGAAHAFLWDRGAMTDLGGPANSSGCGLAINDRGQVVVEYFGIGAPPIAVWERGSLTDLQANPTSIGPVDYAINKHGQVMGSNNNRQQPYLWDRGTMTYLLEGITVANVDVEEASPHRKPGISDPLGVRVVSQGSRAGNMELSLSLDRAGEVRVSLYDVTGRLLATRAPEHLGAGQSTLRWVPGVRESGLYFARVRTEAGSVTRKWTVLR